VFGLRFEKSFFKLVLLDINILVKFVVSLHLLFFRLGCSKVEAGGLPGKFNLSFCADLAQMLDCFTGRVGLQQVMNPWQTCKVQDGSGGSGDCWKV
jgi:hypothetical protein